MWVTVSQFYVTTGSPPFDFCILIFLLAFASLYFVSPLVFTFWSGLSSVVRLCFTKLFLTNAAVKCQRENVILMLDLEPEASSFIKFFQSVSIIAALWIQIARTETKTTLHTDSAHDWACAPNVNLWIGVFASNFGTERYSYLFWSITSKANLLKRYFPLHFRIEFHYEKWCRDHNYCAYARPRAT